MQEFLNDHDGDNIPDIEEIIEGVDPGDPVSTPGLGLNMKKIVLQLPQAFYSEDDIYGENEFQLTLNRDFPDDVTNGSFACSNLHNNLMSLLSNIGIQKNISGIGILVCQNSYPVTTGHAIMVKVQSIHTSAFFDKS